MPLFAHSPRTARPSDSGRSPSGVRQGSASFCQFSVRAPSGLRKDPVRTSLGSLTVPVRDVPKGLLEVSEQSRREIKEALSRRSSRSRNGSRGGQLRLASCPRPDDRKQEDAPNDGMLELQRERGKEREESDEKISASDNKLVQACLHWPCPLAVDQINLSELSSSLLQFDFPKLAFEDEY